MQGHNAFCTRLVRHMITISVWMDSKLLVCLDSCNCRLISKRMSCNSVLNILILYVVSMSIKGLPALVPGHLGQLAQTNNKLIDVKSEFREPIEALVHSRLCKGTAMCCYSCL